MGRLLIATFDDSRSYEADRPDSFVAYPPSSGAEAKALFLASVSSSITSDVMSSGGSADVLASVCCAFYLIHACFLLGLYFDNEDGGDMFLRNVS
jgi:hypothetical protein